MYVIYTMGMFLIYTVIVCGLIGLHKKDLYISRLESENRRLKETLILTKRKANRYKLMLTTTLDNK